MIDIHSHILPEVDDGSSSLEESVEMCRCSAEDGVRVMVATPHAHDGVHRTHARSVLEEKIALLNERTGGNPRVELGCELRFTHDLVNQVRGGETAPSIAGGPYVLVEFPHSLVPPGSDRVLFELITNGFRPVIAHPERNQLLMTEPDRFYALVDNGVLGQLDAGSITGQFGKRVLRAARVMLESGLVHAIASDCHNTRNRLPGLSAALEAAGDIVGQEYATAMVSANPGAIVRGEVIPSCPTPEPPKRPRKWLLFSR
jgi:protein-tyrosine phosphatase